MQLHLPSQGINPNDLETHSLRAGGAMVLKLNGISDKTTKKAGRRTSIVCLQYIHCQIEYLAVGVLAAIKTKVPFRNLGGKTK